MMLIPVMVRDAFPVFASTMADGLPLTPTVWGEKFCRAGNVDRKGPFTPIPRTAIAKGLIRVLSVIVIVPNCEPVAVGEKVTLTAQLAPALRLAPQVFVSAKLALGLILAMVNFTLLGLLIVMV